MSVSPSLLAVWLAEEVIPDDRTHKVTVRDIFNLIEVPTGASSYDAPAVVFFSLTGLRGRVDLRLCVVDLESMEVLLERPVRVEHDDPVGAFDVWVRVNSHPIPHPGVYAWELYHGYEMLGCARLTVRTEDGRERP